MDALEQLLVFLESEFLCLTQFDEDFVSSSYDSNFSDYDDVSNLISFSVRTEPEYQEKLRILYRRLIDVHLYQQNEGIWDMIKERAFNPKKLCLLLWFSLEDTFKSTNNREELEEGILSARVYMALCCLNSSQAYDIFNPFLYQKTISVLRLLYRALTFNLLDFNPTKSVGAKKSKGKKKKDIETSESEGWLISEEERADFYILMKDSLDSLFLLLNEVSLSSSEECVNATVTLVRDIARFDLSAATRVGSCFFEEFQSLQRLSDRSFALSHRLCQARHAGSRLVLPKLCLPRLLFMTFDNDFLPAKIPNFMLQARDKMVQFLEIMTEAQKEYSAIMALIQNVAYRCPDRAEYRSNVSVTIVSMLRLLPLSHRKEFLNFLYAFGSMNKPTSRSFAIELAVSLLSDDLFYEIFNATENRNVTKNESKLEQSHSIANEENVSLREENQQKRNRKNKKRPQPLATMSPTECILRLLIRGVQDKSAAIRSRSLQLLQPKLEDFQMCTRLNEIAQKLEEEKNAIMKKQDDGQENEEANNGLSALLQNEKQIFNVTDNPLLNLFLQCCDDSRVSCRRWALVALTVLYLHLHSDEQRNLCIEKLEARCRDQSMVIRKQAAENLTFLMQQRFSDAIERAWLRSVLPQIVDREVSVQQKCSEMFHALVIIPIMERSEGMVWGLLFTIEREVHLRRLLLRCLLFQYNEKKLPAALVEMLLEKTRTEHTANAAWMMLAELSVFLDVNPTIAIDAWFQLDTDSEFNTTSYIAKILANRVNELNKNQRERLKEDISRKLLDYKVHVLHISSVYYAFARICDAIGENAPGAAYLERFNSEWLATSTHHVDESIYHPVIPLGSRTELQPPVLQPIRFSNAANIGEEKLIKIIFSIGECVQYTPRLINNDIFEQLKLMLASDVIATITGHYAVQSGRPTPVPIPPPSQNTEYGFARPTDAAAGGGSQRPTDVGPNSQPTDFGSQRPTEFATLSQRPTDFRGTTFKQNRTICTEVLTKRVRAQAVLTLGKLCLQDEKLAKKCVPVFARQLKTNKDHIIRNNIVVVICDLCIRYTLLVDRYSAILASCLKDHSIMVRHQTLTLLTNLIKEQFLKWEGQIMYRFVSALLDFEKDVKEYAEFCLKDILLPQFPKMFVNHFLECLFYFNNVPLQSVSIANEALGDEITCDLHRNSALSGKQNTNPRMHLYKFMLKTFSDEEKFAVSVKICKEVFQQLVEGTLQLNDPDVEILLMDSIELMCCQEMKLTMKEGERDPDDDDEDEPPEQIREGARKLIANVFRQGIVEAIMPHVIALKHFLSEKRNPIIRDAVRLIVEICKDHKEKIDEFLAGDAQLKAEIEFDIRRLQEKEKRKKLADAQAALAKITNPHSGQTIPTLPQEQALKPDEERTIRDQNPLDNNEAPNVPAETTAIHIEPNEIPNPVTQGPGLIEVPVVETQDVHMEVTALEIESAPIAVQNENEAVSTPLKPTSAGMEISTTPERTAPIAPRAISTPEYGKIENLTFAAFDLSAIPMESPIPRTQPRSGRILREIKEEPE